MGFTAFSGNAGKSQLYLVEISEVLILFGGKAVMQRQLMPVTKLPQQCVRQREEVLKC